MSFLRRDCDEREDILSKMLQAALQVLSVGDGSAARFLQSQVTKDALRAAGEVAFRALGEEHTWSKQRISELETINVSLERTVRDLKEQCKIALAQAVQANAETDTLQLDLGRQRRLLAEALAKASAEQRDTEEMHTQEVQAMQFRLRSLELQLRSKGKASRATFSPKQGVVEQEETIARHVNEAQKLKDEILVASKKEQHMSSLLADSEARYAELHAFSERLIEQQESCRFCRDRSVRNLPAVPSARPSGGDDVVRRNPLKGHTLFNERPKSAGPLSIHNHRDNALQIGVACTPPRPSTAIDSNSKRKELRESHEQKHHSVESWNLWSSRKESSPPRSTSACSTAVSTWPGRSTSVTPDMSSPPPMPLSPDSSLHMLQEAQSSIPDNSETAESRDESSANTSRKTSTDENFQQVENISERLPCEPSESKERLTECSDSSGPSEEANQSNISESSKTNMPEVSKQSETKDSEIIEQRCDEHDNMMGQKQQAEVECPQVAKANNDLHPIEAPCLAPTKQPEIADIVQSRDPEKNLRKERMPSPEAVQEIVRNEILRRRESSKSKEAVPWSSQGSDRRESSKSKEAVPWSSQGSDLIVTEQVLPDRLEGQVLPDKLEADDSPPRLRARSSLASTAKKVAFETDDQTNVSASSSEFDGESEDYNMDGADDSGGLTWAIRRQHRESQKLISLLAKQDRRESVENPNIRFEKHFSQLQKSRQEVAKRPKESDIALQGIEKLWQDVKDSRTRHDRHVFQNVYRPSPPDGPPPELQSQQVSSRRFQRWWISCASEQQVVVARSQCDAISEPRFTYDSVDSPYLSEH